MVWLNYTVDKKLSVCNCTSSISVILQVSYKAIQDRILKLTVFDVDRHKRHNVIGHALYPLREHDCEVNERVVVWRDLEKEVTEVSELHFHFFAMCISKFLFLFPLLFCTVTENFQFMCFFFRPHQIEERF